MRGASMRGQLGRARLGEATSAPSPPQPERPLQQPTPLQQLVLCKRPGRARRLLLSRFLKERPVQLVGARPPRARPQARPRARSHWFGAASRAAHPRQQGRQPENVRIAQMHGQQPASKQASSTNGPQPAAGWARSTTPHAQHRKPPNPPRNHPKPPQGRHPRVIQAGADLRGRGRGIHCAHAGGEGRRRPCGAGLRRPFGVVSPACSALVLAALWGLVSAAHLRCSRPPVCAVLGRPFGLVSAALPSVLSRPSV